MLSYLSHICFGFTNYLTFYWFYMNSYQIYLKSYWFYLNSFSCYQNSYWWLNGNFLETSLCTLLALFHQTSALIVFFSFQAKLSRASLRKEVGKGLRAVLLNSLFIHWKLFNRERNKPWQEFTKFTNSKNHNNWLIFF